MEFIIRIRVPLDKVTTVFQCGEVLSVDPVRTKAPHKIYNGSDTGREVIDKMLAQVGRGNEIDLAHMEKVFKARGRNPHSVSPILTQLIREKYLKKLGNGQYKVLV